jgi:hypothetical protein
MTKRKTKWMLERACKDKVMGFQALNALIGGWMRGDKDA